MFAHGYVDALAEQATIAECSVKEYSHLKARMGLPFSSCISGLRIAVIKFSSLAIASQGTWERLSAIFRPIVLEESAKLLQTMRLDACSVFLRCPLTGFLSNQTDE